MLKGGAGPTEHLPSSWLSAWCVGTGSAPTFTKGRLDETVASLFMPGLHAKPGPTGTSSGSEDAGVSYLCKHRCEITWDASISQKQEAGRTEWRKVSRME